MRACPPFARSVCLGPALSVIVRGIVMHFVTIPLTIAD